MATTKLIKSKDDAERLIDEWGFLPFFANAIEGFSLEERIDLSFWFGDGPGAWEWKGPIVRDGYVYARIFGRKCGFATVEWYKHLAAWRRDGYDFDARVDDGLAPHQDSYVFNIIDKYGRILSHGLKNEGGFHKGGRKGFETIIARLQMQCYVCVSDFPYQIDKNGNEYGWGVTEYSTPEHLYGTAFTKGLYKREPEESKAIIAEHMRSIFPRASAAQIERFVGKNR